MMMVVQDKHPTELVPERQNGKRKDAASHECPHSRVQEFDCGQTAIVTRCLLGTYREHGYQLGGRFAEIIAAVRSRVCDLTHGML
jgi:hypothetical protein